MFGEKKGRFRPAGGENGCCERMCLICTPTAYLL